MKINTEATMKTKKNKKSPQQNSKRNQAMYEEEKNAYDEDGYDI